MSSVPRRRLVVLRLRAPRPVRPGDVADVLGLLAGSRPVPLERLAVEVVDGATVEVRAVAQATSAPAAGRLVVDEVRAVLGLDGDFVRWLVDARNVEVSDLNDG